MSSFVVYKRLIRHARECELGTSVSISQRMGDGELSSLKINIIANELKSYIR